MADVPYVLAERMFFLTCGVRLGRGGMVNRVLGCIVVLHLGYGRDNLFGLQSHGEW